MPKKKRSAFIVSARLAGRLPWWAHLLIAGLSFAVLRFFATGVAQYIVPLVFVATAALSFGRRRAQAFARIKREPEHGEGAGKPERVDGGKDLHAVWKDRARLPRGPTPTGTWSLELLNLLEWKRLEEVCAAYFQALDFRARVTRTGADGGVDMHLFAAGADTPSIVVQCKAWKTYKVGVKPVRELFGVMAAQKVAEGIFVTTGAYTAEAYDFAAGKNIHLIDGPDLVGKLRALTPERQRALLELATAGDYMTPTCPSCDIKMIERSAKIGGDPFWGCPNYPRCHTTLRITRLRKRSMDRA